MSSEWLLYLRKSKGIAGIARQRTSTTDHLARHGGTIAMEFPEADSTAYRNPLAPLPPRPKFDAMLAEMARRPGVGVAAWHADRLGRDPETTEILIRACMRGGHLITTTRGGDYDVSTANGRKRLRDDLNAAAGEVDHNVERILEQKAEAAAEGRWLGGRRPFGYQIDIDAPGGLVPDKREAALIGTAAADILAGTSLYAAIGAWHDAGVTGTAGGHLSPANARKILLAPRTAGLQTGGSPGKWPAIIPADRWRLLCALLADESRHKGPGPRRAHLLTGIALCGACGSPVIAAPGDRGPRYRCSAAARMLPGHEKVRHVTAHLEGADEFAGGLAVSRLKRDDAHLLLAADRTAEREELLGEDAAQKVLFDEQWDLYRAKAITARELAEGRAEIEAEREGIRGRLAAIDEADLLAPMLSDPGAAWDSADLDQRRAVVSALMFLTVFHARRGRPAGWRPGAAYFDVDVVDVRWCQALPSDG